MSETFEYYYKNPELKEYFDSLSQPVKNRIMRSGVQIATLGELMQCAEHARMEQESSKENEVVN